MGLSKQLVPKEKQSPPQTIFEMFFGAPTCSVEIHQGKSRKVAIMGDISLPIVDNHLILHDEHGNMLAACRGDLTTILEEL